MATVTLFPRRKREAVPESTRKHGPLKFTSESIAALFHLPLNRAAEELGVSKTSMKQICRRLGITCWPYKRRGPPAGCHPGSRRDGQMPEIPQQDLTNSCHQPSAAPAGSREQFSIHVPAYHELQMSMNHTSHPSEIRPHPTTDMMPLQGDTGKITSSYYLHLPSELVPYHVVETWQASSGVQERACLNSCASSRSQVMEPDKCYRGDGVHQTGAHFAQKQGSLWEHDSFSGAQVTTAVAFRYDLPCHSEQPLHDATFQNDQHEDHNQVTDGGYAGTNFSNTISDITRNQLLSNDDDLAWLCGGWHLHM